MYPHEFVLLWDLHELGGRASAYDLAHMRLPKPYVNKTPQTVANQLRSLAGRGLVHYDRDAQMWDLTDAGRELVEA